MTQDQLLELVADLWAKSEHPEVKSASAKIEHSPYYPDGVRVKFTNDSKGFLAVFPERGWKEFRGEAHR